VSKKRLKKSKSIYHDENFSSYEMHILEEMMSGKYVNHEKALRILSRRYVGNNNTHLKLKDMYTIMFSRMKNLLPENEVKKAILVEIDKMHTKGEVE